MLSNIPGLRPYRLERGIRIIDADAGTGTETASASDLEALVIVDVASGRIALSNSAAEQLFGYSAGEAVGLRFVLSYGNKTIFSAPSARRWGRLPSTYLLLPNETWWYRSGISTRRSSTWR